MLSVSASWAEAVLAASAIASIHTAIHWEGFKYLIGLILSPGLRADRRLRSELWNDMVRSLFRS
jgi:hypothetical protein